MNEKVNLWSPRPSFDLDLDSHDVSSGPDIVSGVSSAGRNSLPYGPGPLPTHQIQTGDRMSSLIRRRHVHSSSSPVPATVSRQSVSQCVVGPFNSVLHTAGTV